MPEPRKDSYSGATILVVIAVGLVVLLWNYTPPKRASYTTAAASSTQKQRPTKHAQKQTPSNNHLKDKLFRIAQRSRQKVADVTYAYNYVKRIAKGRSEQQLLNLTEGICKAATIDQVSCRDAVRTIQTLTGEY